LHGLVTLAARDGVCFPVADLVAIEHLSRTLMNRDSLGDMRFFVFPGVPAVFTPAMSSDQERDKGWHLLVNPLIDRLMTNTESRVLSPESTGDQLWRPSHGDMSFHIVPNKIGLEPLSSMRLMIAPIGSLLGLMGKIVAGVNRRSISLQLAAKSARASVQDLGNRT